MLTRPIPKTQEPLPVVGLGTWQTFDVGADRQALDQRKEVLRIMFEAGGRVIDSSPMYGRAEEVVGDAARRKCKRTARRSWPPRCGPPARRPASSRCRPRPKLRAPTIDLMQIHNLVDWRTHLATLRAWKEQKKIRYIGITHYTSTALDELAAIIRAERIDFVQFGYSIASRAAEARLLPLCAERGVARHRQSARSTAAPCSGRSAARPLPDVGGGRRLRELGAVLPQVHPRPPRRHLRHPRHGPPRPRPRQLRRRHLAASPTPPSASAWRSSGTGCEMVSGEW